MKKDIWRAVTEIGFIIFLFYSNLLMGGFTRSGMARGKDLAWAIQDIFSEVNFALRASCVNAVSSFAMRSLHINNQRATRYDNASESSLNRCFA